MTFNNLYINERCMEMRRLAEDLQLHMREGDMESLRRKVSRIAKISDETCNRLHDMAEQ